MNNLEFICQELRKAGRADAAQELEAFTERQWREYSAAPDRRLREYRDGPTADTVLGMLMGWCATPQGYAYWEGVYGRLIAHRRYQS